MKFLQHHSLVLGCANFVLLVISFSLGWISAGLAFSLLFLINVNMGFHYINHCEPWRYTSKALSKWLRLHEQSNLESLFCLYLSMHTRGVFQSCVNRERLEEVSLLCAQELMDYFGTNNTQRMTHEAFVVLRNFPSEMLSNEKVKAEYQAIVCQTILERLQNRFDARRTFLPPVEILIGCAASGIRYRTASLEQLVDLAYVTQQEAQRSYKTWMVANSEIQARKLDIDECIQGFQSQGWEAEFNPFFQPIIDSETLCVVGSESLARWQLGGFRILSAKVFKDIAGELHHIEAIDMSIITKTFAIIRKMMLARIIPYTFKIVLNVSNESLKKGFAGRMHFLAEHHGLHPTQIEFDLKDSAFSEPESLAVIKELREIGFRISLDVFNENAFDLQAFARADFDSIKLDFSVYSLQLQQVYVSLKESATRKGIEVLAKGIERKEILEAATKLGCTYLQGNYFTQPIPESTFEVFMRKYQTGLLLDTCLG